MPLTKIQLEVASLLAKDRSPDSYLAGGAAMHMAPQSKRYSNDLDYFHDSEERVASAFACDRSTLEAAGFTLTILLTQPGFISATVTRDSSGTKVEWAHDTAWRFMPPIENEVSGYTLHAVDLAINKLLALVGRDEPRDYLDTLEVVRDTLSLGALCWAAAGKDPGYTPSLVLSMLRRRGKYQKEDFARLMLREAPDLQNLKQEWLAALDEADAFISSRNSDEMGCLYFSISSHEFVSDFEVGDPDVKPHYGRPGGVSPQVG